jgi:hypothetical protein
MTTQTISKETISLSSIIQNYNRGKTLNYSKNNEAQEKVDVSIGSLSQSNTQIINEIEQSQTTPLDDLLTGITAYISKKRTKRDSSSLSSEENKKTKANTQAGKWTPSEVALFEKLYSQYGKNWGRIAKGIPTRTQAQVRSHAQKVFLSQEKKNALRPELDLPDVAPLKMKKIDIALPIEKKEAFDEKVENIRKEKLALFLSFRICMTIPSTFQTKMQQFTQAKEGIQKFLDELYLLNPELESIDAEIKDTLKMWTSIQNEINKAS